jgi:YNFM family putative membrane transporter
MRRTLPEAPAAPRSERRRSAAAAQLRNPAVLRPALAGGALFFTFVSVGSYVTFRLTEPPFDYGTGAVSLLFVLWVLGAAGPFAGRLADRVGWRRVSLGGVLLAGTGVLFTLPDQIVTVGLGMGLVVLGMFSGVTAAQLGVTEAGEADRGTASAVYFTFYYVAGAAAGFLPGLAWQRYDWPGVAILALAVLSLGTLALCIRPTTRLS